MIPCTVVFPSRCCLRASWYVLFVRNLTSVENNEEVGRREKTHVEPEIGQATSFGGQNVLGFLIFFFFIASTGSARRRRVANTRQRMAKRMMLVE